MVWMKGWCTSGLRSMSAAPRRMRRSHALGRHLVVGQYDDGNMCASDELSITQSRNFCDWYDACQSHTIMSMSHRSDEVGGTEQVGTAVEEEVEEAEVESWVEEELDKEEE